MRTPSRFSLSRLSRELYEAALAKAKRKGYAFVGFDAFLGDALPPRFVALRHDIDFAPEHAVQMAELEHAASVRSTYFVLVDGHFYDPLEKANVLALRRISSLGHQIGLHYSVSAAVEPDLGREVAFRLEVLSSIVGSPIRAFSQHDPVNAGFAPIVLPPGHPPCVDAYEVIRRHDLLYVSDSAMMWRRYTFDSALDEDRNLCLLAHPHSWLHGETDYVALIRDLEAKEVAKLSERYDAFVNALEAYYDRRANEGT